MPKIDKNNATFGSSNFSDTLHYPDDLAVGITHPDCVKFTIGTNPGVSLEPVTNKIKEKAQAAKSASIESANNLVNKLTAERSSLLNLAEKTVAQAQRIQTLNAKLNVKGDLKTNARRIIGDGSISVGDIGDTISKGAKNIKGTVREVFDALAKGAKSNVFTAEKFIYLPMPENLVYNEPVDWTGTELGAMKGLADMALGKEGGKDALGGAVLGQAGNVLAGGAGTIVSKLLGGGLLGGAVLGGLGGGASLQGAIETKLRVQSNPFKEQTFQGVGFRPFEFSFVFNARSQSEVITIKEIINTFRQYSKPSLESPDSAIFKYPGEFIIEFLTNNGNDSLNTNNYLPKLKHCICKSVNTNFTTAGWKSFEDGAPATITLQLGFEEIDIITKESVEEGY